MYSGSCNVHLELMELRRCIFILIDDRLFSHTGMALDAAAAAAAVDSLSLHPCSPPLLPRGQTGMVSSRRTCHCHRGGDGSRSVRAEGGRRKASSTACHCSAAAAALEPHQEDLSILYLCNFTSTPWGPLRLWRWTGFLNYQCCLWECCFAPAAGAEWMCVPLRIQASDNGTSRGNLATSLLAKLYLRAMLSG